MIILNNKVFFVSLGCDKNLVDSEVMLGILADNNYIITSDEADADVIVINTCSFIHDAKEESIETILEMAEYKKNGKCKALIVTGCLSERYKQELFEELPEIDGALGTSNYDEILKVINNALENGKYSCFSDIDYSPDYKTKRMLSPTTAFAYLKIAEGCNNNCTYCIIPSLRGKYRSRKLEELVAEAEQLVVMGKNEIIVVAQDTTKYGMDLYGKRMLPELLKQLCKIDGLEWIRLLYCYPEDITDELIETIKNEKKVLHYIDIPIQHINNRILNSMARTSNRATIENVISKLRNDIPDICIRSTLIVGFPGETEEEYIELRDFVKNTKLNRLGVFTYSLEEGTPAAEMDLQISEDIKKRRQEELMLIQQEISFQNNEALIGKTLDVIVEGYLPDEEVYCGRSYMDAPNVDGMIFFQSPFEHITGQIVRVDIKKAQEYDLIGEAEE